MASSSDKRNGELRDSVEGVVLLIFFLPTLACYFTFLLCTGPRARALDEEEEEKGFVSLKSAAKQRRSYSTINNSIPFPQTVASQSAAENTLRHVMIQALPQPVSHASIARLDQSSIDVETTGDSIPVLIHSLPQASNTPSATVVAISQQSIAGIPQ
jgi:hypothetical protein